MKKYADYLVVAVQDEDCVEKYKPSAKVMRITEERVEMQEALRVYRVFQK